MISNLYLFNLFEHDKYDSWPSKQHSNYHNTRNFSHAGDLILLGKSATIPSIHYRKWTSEDAFATG